MRVYDCPFTWLKRTLTKNPTTGQEEETFSPNGTLWGELKELGANRQLYYGMMNSQATLEVRLQQFPSLDANDRLRELRFNRLLILDGLNVDFEQNELVVRCHRITEID